MDRSKGVVLHKLFHSKARFQKLDEISAVYVLYFPPLVNCGCPENDCIFFFDFYFSFGLKSLADGGRTTAWPLLLLQTLESVRPLKSSSFLFFVFFSKSVGAFGFLLRVFETYCCCVYRLSFEFRLEEKKYRQLAAYYRWSLNNSAGKIFLFRKNNLPVGWSMIQWCFSPFNGSNA